jgi:hypothetical protein
MFLIKELLRILLGSPLQAVIKAGTEVIWQDRGGEHWRQVSTVARLSVCVCVCVDG